MSQALAVHKFLEKSCANGPGWRSVIWVQGCSLNCPGCFNPETHERANPDYKIETLFQKIFALADSGEIEGITVSGGEPLEQCLALASFLQLIKENTSLSSIVLTGYNASEASQIKGFDQVAANLDVLIAGRYIEKLRIARELRGSSNKKFYFFTDRYSTSDFLNLVPGEVIISAEDMMSTGIEPLRLR